MIVWPFSWDDVPSLLLLIATGLTIFALVARAVLGPVWPFYIHNIVISLKRSYAIGLAMVMGLLFSVTIFSLFSLTSEIGCGTSSFADATGTVTNPINCEVTWIWER